MKRLLVFLIALFFTHGANSQTFGGYVLGGCMNSVSYPEECTVPFITGFPDDSIVVNYSQEGDSIEGHFSVAMANHFGKDLLLETGFNRSNYRVQLKLNNGQYSVVHQVSEGDWVHIDSIEWTTQQTNCLENYYWGARLILALDFADDFNLTGTDVVVGIKIVFQYSPGWPDLAGVYLTKPMVGLNEFANDNFARLYPNPCTEEMQLTVKAKGKCELKIYDSQFRRQIEQVFVDQTAIDMKMIAPGIYFYEISNADGNVSSGSWIKQ